jgi:hypothetical protein
VATAPATVLATGAPATYADEGGQPAPTRTAAPCAPDPAAVPARVVTVAMQDNTVEPAETEVPRGALARLEVEDASALLHDGMVDDVPIQALRGGGRP